jgi:hypothetical protein
LIEARIEINHLNPKYVELRLGQFAEQQAPGVISRALNRAATAARTAAIKEIRKTYYLPHNADGSKMSIDQIAKVVKASKNKLGALIISRGNAIPLDRYKYTPSAPSPQNPPNAVRVSVKKTGLKDLMHVFVADINHNGKYLLMERTGKIITASKGRYKGKQRELMEHKFGPAIPEMFNQPNIRNASQKRGAEEYEKRLDHEIKRVWEANK